MNWESLVLSCSSQAAVFIAVGEERQSVGDMSH